MAFFKFRQRGQTSPQPQPEPTGRSRGRAKEAASTTPPDSIENMRRRARHRLVGAAVLVLLAVIGFPLLFDTQPRPVAVNAPITIPDKDQVAPLTIPEPVRAGDSLDEREEVVPPTLAAAPTPPPARTQPDADARASAEAEARAEAAAKAQAEQAAARARREEQAAARKEQEARARKEQEARAQREAEQRAKREEAARARALLEGRSPATAKPAPAAASGSRFIVQVGAFADAAAVREVRQKAERAGLKTYTQVVNTKDGPRTRVRVGPFASREEANQAAATLKKVGLAGAVLSL